MLAVRAGECRIDDDRIVSFGQRADLDNPGFRHRRHDRRWLSLGWSIDVGLLSRDVDDMLCLQLPTGISRCGLLLREGFPEKGNSERRFLTGRLFGEDVRG